MGKVLISGLDSFFLVFKQASFWPFSVTDLVEKRNSSSGLSRVTSTESQKL